jgi:hypothetical protein
MYYTPAIVIPGLLSHFNLDKARSTALRDGSYVLDNNFDLFEDYRGLAAEAVAIGEKLHRYIDEHGTSRKNK